MEISEEYKKMADRKMLDAITGHKYCLLNVGRQIGSTTFLFCYCGMYFHRMDANVVMHFNSKLQCEDWWGKSGRLVSSLGGGCAMDSKTYTIRKWGSDAVFRLTFGKTNFANTSSGEGYAADVSLYVVNDADFTQWEPTWEVIHAANPQAQIVLASSPSVFDGRWTTFKKIIVSGDRRWKVVEIPAPVSEDDFPLQADEFDAQCRNYGQFFKPMKILHDAIGDDMFNQKQQEK